MKKSLTIKSRLFIGIAAILACSYAILFLASVISIENFTEEEIVKDLEVAHRFAKSQLNSRPEMVLEALKLPVSSEIIQKLFISGDSAALQQAAARWTKSFDFIDMLTIVDAGQNVIGRSNGKAGVDSFMRGALLDSLFDRKQPFITTELINYGQFCQETTAEVCRSLAGNQDVMAQVVFMPVISQQGRLLGAVVAANALNKDSNLPYMQQKIFGKNVEMLITQKGERIASTISDSNVLAQNLDGNVLQALKGGYLFSGNAVFNDRECEMIAEGIHNHKGSFIGSVAVALPKSHFSGIRQDNFQYIVWCGFFSLTVIFALAYFTAWQFTAPIRRLSEAVKAIETGDLSRKIPEVGSLEFRELAEAFNRMTVALGERDSVIKSQNEALNSLNGELELILSERSAELESETSLQKAIVKSLMDGLIVTDNQLNIIQINPAAVKMLGSKSDKVIGTPLSLFCQQYALPELERLVKGETAFSVGEEETLVLLHGGRRRLRFTVSSYKDDKGVDRGLLLGIRDVTTDSEVDRLKGGFISKVSHELKTPLTSMKGSLEFILKKGKWLTGVEREMLGVCLRNTERLINMVVNIIKLSRIEAGQTVFDLRPLQIAEVVTYLVEEMKVKALERNISIVNDVPMDLPKVNGDAERLNELLGNLLSNAIKFSPADSVVILTAQIDTGFLSLSVADSADVIAEESRGALFSRFQQMGTPEDGSFCGSGLGLAICKEIITRHGGAITYAPGASGGNVFTFKVPLYEESYDKG